ncbi:MAG TPA: DUF4127 family protein, partial [Candidatus Obscuribacterales bacterium]
ARELNLEDKVVTYAGADEVLATLLAFFLAQRAGLRHNNASQAPSAHLIFSPDTKESCFSRYEGQPIGQSVQNQLRACGVKLAPQEAHADFIVLVHLPESRQGDHIHLPGQPDLRKVDTDRAAASTLAQLEKAGKPVVLCDVAYANGADPLLIDGLLSKPALLSKLWGYGGWNTTGNASGSAIALGVCRWFGGQAEQRRQAADIALKRCLFVRFADDYAYQTQVRPQISGTMAASELAALMAPHLSRIGDALNCHPGAVTVKQPWQRAFEIEVSMGAAEAAAGSL